MMSYHKFFSSRTSALILGVSLGASALVGGISYAQENTLTIPSDLANAVIAIREIYLSPDGTKTGNQANIQLNGTNGTITANGEIFTKGTLTAKDANLKGNLQVNGDTTLGDVFAKSTIVNEKLIGKYLGEVCTHILQDSNEQEECILSVKPNGEVEVNGFLQSIDAYSEDITNIFFNSEEYTENNEYITNNLGLWKKSSNSNMGDIYFGNPDDVSGSNVLVRVGIKKDSGYGYETDAQLIAKGEIQTREALTITKKPNDTTDANDGLLKKNLVGNGVSESKISQSPDGERMFIDHTTKNGGGGGIALVGNGGTQPTKVGINTTSPTEALDVVGNAHISQAVKANTYLYNSDIRYKSAISSLDNALDKILALNGYHYYNKLSKRNDIGVITQEVEKVFPELVHTDAEGYKSVEYGNLVAPLIEAVKELNDKVDNLEARLQALEAQ